MPRSNRSNKKAVFDPLLVPMKKWAIPRYGSGSRQPVEYRQTDKPVLELFFFVRTKEFFPRCKCIHTKVEEKKKGDTPL